MWTDRAEYVLEHAGCRAVFDMDGGHKNHCGNLEFLSTGTILDGHVCAVCIYANAGRTEILEKELKRRINQLLNTAQELLKMGFEIKVNKNASGVNIFLIKGTPLGFASIAYGIMIVDYEFRSERDPVGQLISFIISQRLNNYNLMLK